MVIQPPTQEQQVVTLALQYSEFTRRQLPNILDNLVTLDNVYPIDTGKDIMPVEIRFWECLMSYLLATTSNLYGGNVQQAIADWQTMWLDEIILIYLTTDDNIQSLERKYIEIFNRFNEEVMLPAFVPLFMAERSRGLRPYCIDSIYNTTIDRIVFTITMVPIC